ncbi:exonuclease domain-containing protein [Candidatus Woesearchaeota archaeon]|nr:exonuclease domain-containing protein [Candidatus Woesearchaeota archaeon]
MQYIIFDLEATCWEGNKSKASEIIEIGAVKLNSELKIIDTFSNFVKPTINPELSDFCTKLTSIIQEDVSKAEQFEKVMKEFEYWISSNGQKPYLCSWGFYDKRQILEECKIKRYEGKIIGFLENHISIKHQFAEIKKVKPCGMNEALKMLNLSLEGVHHRAISDAKNITKIFVNVFDKLKFS